MPEGLPYYKSFDAEESCFRAPEPVPAFKDALFDGGLQHIGTNVCTSMFPPLTSVHIRKQSNGNDNQEFHLSSLNFDCKDPDNALAYIDDILNGELAANDSFDADNIQDFFAIFSCPHDLDLLSNTPLLPLTHDQLNDSVADESVCHRTSQLQKHFPSLEVNALSTAQIFVNRTGNKASISAGSIGASCAEDHVDWCFKENISPWPWLSQQRMRQCDHCEVLRQIVHTNGPQGTKLEIHGCEGQNYHAVLQTRFWLNDGCPPTVEQQMVEFPVGNSDYVKQFLTQYSLLRRKEGFVLQQDSIMTANAGDRMCSANRIDGFGCFKEAAKELGICPTVLKKICRRNGICRWPHRKIKSIERIIATLEQTIADGAGQGDGDIRKEIAMLRNERSQLCAGLMGQA